MNYRIVVDTNVIVSAALNKHGRPAAIIDAVISGQHVLIISETILEEVQRVFAYSKIQKLLQKHRVSPEEIANYLSIISQLAIMVPGQLSVEVVVNDSSDNMFLTAALEGRADVIISGDHHLCDLQYFKDMPILTPAEFLEQLDPKSKSSVQDKNKEDEST